MSLTGIQQNQGDISGYLTLGPKPQGSGPFTGTIDTARQLRFTVTNTAGNAEQPSLFFEGTMRADGNLVGNYCTIDQQGQCSGGDYGVWSAVPTP
jgi:hypothetical protein